MRISSCHELASSSLSGSNEESIPREVDNDVTAVEEFGTHNRHRSVVESQDVEDREIRDYECPATPSEVAGF